MRTKRLPPAPRLEAIDPTWRVLDGIHGGLALAHAAKLAHAEGAGVPRALHGTFLAPIPPGRALDATLVSLRRGRSSADVRVEVHDAERRALDVVATFHRRGTGPRFERFPAPAVLPPNQCEEFALPVELIPFASHTEVRPANGARPLSGGPDPELVAWVRFLDADLEPWQAVTVLLDALPPALYATATTLAAIPTTMLTVALTDDAHDCDPRGWSLVRIRTEVAAGGWAVETSMVWNQRRDLLGYASQQRRVLTPLH